MGIKNLKTLLLEIGSLTKIISIIPECVDNIFVDTMSFFISIAHCVNNIDELNDTFFSYIDQWNKYGNITLFVDRGTITIKESLREKRRNVSKNMSKKKILDIEKINNEISSLDINDLFYNEIKTELELKIFKLNFYVFISNSNKIKELLDKILLSLPLLYNNIKIVYCDGYDAEFIMCRDAKEIVNVTGKWPLIISTDQDTLLFSSCDSVKKIIKTMNQLYLFIPCSKSRYLSKLVALVNGCDYFSGLNGFCISDKSLTNIQLFDDFTLDNIIQSLIIKNYIRKTDKIIDVNSIINFINRYSDLDYNIYDTTPPDSCTIQEFIFSATYKIWKNFDNTLVKGVSLCSSLICLLEPKNNIIKEDIDHLCKIIKGDKYKKSKLSDIKYIIDIFGYETNKSDNIKFGIFNLKDIMLCYKDKFYINNEIILKKNNNKIINIS
ncbi:Flap endonuclease FEN-1 [Brazilian porcupinepox virus 1]|nr:Flap endonuclease FEN-1 [Brazilian porcupinepox virus 1]